MPTPIDRRPRPAKHKGAIPQINAMAGWLVSQAAPITLLCGIIPLTACTAGPRNFANDNDRLREENLRLQRRVLSLDSQLQNAQQQIGHLQRHADRTPRTTPDGQPVDAPRLTSLKFDRLSGILDTDSDGTADHARLYVRTLDQHGRFIPVAARASAQVVSINPGHPPTVLGETALTAQEMDAAYRSGITGTHYTITLPIDNKRPVEHEDVTAKVVLTDLQHGTETAGTQSLSHAP